MTLYPFSLLYLLFPLPWSVNFFCLAHLFWAGLGTYVLASRWTGNRFSASVAGFAAPVDIAVHGDRIAQIGPSLPERAEVEIDGEVSDPDYKSFEVGIHCVSDIETSRYQCRPVDSPDRPVKMELTNDGIFRIP
jgi:hypothetical protein